nr:MAG TPA: hypothetical protein [Caudoviricetes sp.]
MRSLREGYSSLPHLCRRCLHEGKAADRAESLLPISEGTHRKSERNEEDG